MSVRLFACGAVFVYRYMIYWWCFRELSYRCLAVFTGKGRVPTHFVLVQ